MIPPEHNKELTTLVADYAQQWSLIPLGMQLKVQLSFVPTQLVLIEETKQVAADVWNMDARKAFLLFKPGWNRIANRLNVWHSEPTPVWYIFERLEKGYLPGIALKSTKTLYEWLTSLGIRRGATIPKEICVQRTPQTTP